MPRFRTTPRSRRNSAPGALSGEPHIRKCFPARISGSKTWREEKRGSRRENALSSWWTKRGGSRRTNGGWSRKKEKEQSRMRTATRNREKEKGIQPHQEASKEIQRHSRSSTGDTTSAATCLEGRG
ncbi:hypothetical protein NDU88_006176 [Pleurodeles waltl]|uniref:Uncharacterized protein n=1 Tax=Pleurodeles waltl TaxID=8319 RepID=A0AAV7MGS9_PLEWA|nr:hypothetical protein NDU88_006176 [Pleurodeles waltl]